MQKPPSKKLLTFFFPNRFNTALQVNLHTLNLNPSRWFSKVCPEASKSLLLPFLLLQHYFKWLCSTHIFAHKFGWFPPYYSLQLAFSLHGIIYSLSKRVLEHHTPYISLLNSWHKTGASYQLFLALKFSASFLSGLQRNLNVCRHSCEHIVKSESAKHRIKRTSGWLMCNSETKLGAT